MCTYYNEIIHQNNRYGHFAIVLFLMLLFIDWKNECEKESCGQKEIATKGPFWQNKISGGIFFKSPLPLGGDLYKLLSFFRCFL